MSTRPRAVLVQRRMAAYRVPFFEQLRERLARRGIDLEVVCGTPSARERLRGDEGCLPWARQVRTLHLGLGGVGAVLLRLPPQRGAAAVIRVLPHEARLLATLWQLLAPRRPGLRLALWGHGANFAERDRRGALSRLRRWMARRADWYFAYTARSVERLLADGYPGWRISCVDNAVDTRALAAAAAGVGGEELAMLRERLGFVGARVGVALGSLHRGRRLEFLFAAADRIRQRRGDFALLIVGDGPERGLVVEAARRRPWLRWAGALAGRDKALHLALGTLLLNPGMVGLGVLDGFACGLPLVTTDCAIHSPEIAYVEHGRNGFVTADELGAFADAVLAVLDDDALRAELSRRCREDASRHSVERMAEAFADGIERALAAPRRGERGA